MGEDRPLRADAARNRGRITEAATRQIMARGPEVPMEAIAEDAGVAVGTLYRHFPTKRDLVVAVLAECFGALTKAAEDAADRIDAGASAIAEFTAFARIVMEDAAGNLAMKAAARSLGADVHEAEERRRGEAAMARLLEAAKAEGTVRPDLGIEDCYLFFITVPVDQPPAMRDRWFELMIAGFRAGAVSTSTAP
ncbi:TetR/AcrR family transcriptional regulator [Glycomyces mayteni]|uniref:TetR/AcrR family transcriptional regulator n=1 Tax=Glycomyces mayteni TaxID=543887 RepID=A0ABW2DEU7_9ACTN|nr:TetR/AcrR family transcriptional regulator [Glycomyces mayteni]